MARPAIPAKFMCRFAARNACCSALWNNHEVMKLLLTLAGVAAVIGLAAPAHADANQDQAFLVALGGAGITYQSPDNAVKAGKTVCDLAKAGKPAVDVVNVLQGQNPGLSQVNAAKFTAISAGVYCPEQLPDSSKGGTGS